MLSYIRADKSFRYYYGGMRFLPYRSKRTAGFYIAGSRKAEGTPALKNREARRCEK